MDRSAQEKSRARKERCVLARAVYLYIQENHASGCALKWSEWFEAHSRAVTMKPGDRIGGECFSFDPLVVSDSLEAAGKGSATVLSGDEVLFITVE